MIYGWKHGDSYHCAACMGTDGERYGIFGGAGWLWKSCGWKPVRSKSKAAKLICSRAIRFRVCGSVHPNDAAYYERERQMAELERKFKEIKGEV